jgi:endonuclease/exonuclease/phosphatase family metal-dependent hydrolase
MEHIVKSKHVAAMAWLWVLIGFLGSVAMAQRESAPLNVMSFNIRYGTANDGDNRWPLRREFLFDVVRNADADLVGVQEALDGQVQELLEALPAYGVIGVGRDDGRTRGEYAAIFYRRDRFRVADSGTFWLSDTPDVVASTSWGNTITRICTWARLIDRDGRGFWHFNVHFDHQSQPSRVRSAALLADRIRNRRVADEPYVVTGDFNVGESNPALAVLTTADSGSSPLLVDSFRVLHPDATPVGTFTGFSREAISGDKIDYVLVPPGTQVLDAQILRASRDGRYPSDHFPVTARIVFGAKSPILVW